ncbi:hypothetical protein IKO50_01340 [bacterium]|nr:hypothetical protein [bacterium]
MADAKIKNNLNKKSMYGLKLKELYAKREALAKKQKELEIEVKNIFDAVDKTEKDGWENLDRNTININNSKRQIGWNKKLEINKIENEIIEVNSKIKSLKIQQKWEFVVSDSKMRGHIQMVVNDISRLNDDLEYSVIDPELKDTLINLKRIVTTIQKYK